LSTTTPWRLPGRDRSLAGSIGEVEYLSDNLDLSTAGTDVLLAWT